MAQSPASPEFIEALKINRDLKLFLVLSAAEIGDESNVNGETGISAVFFRLGDASVAGWNGQNI